MEKSIYNKIIDFKDIKEYSFTSWDNSEVEIQSQGKQVLFFVSLHCLHCVDFLPHISPIEQQFQDVSFILFSTGDVEDHQEMAEYFKWKLPIVHLEHDDIDRLFNIEMLPHMVLLEDGIIKKSGVVDSKADFIQFVGPILNV
ncbi:hypothetical protein D3C77_457110 [compost metagenome]